MSKLPKNILVTGCAGFIGSNFVKEFIKKFPKIKIIGIDDFSTGKREALDRKIIFYEGSITDERLLDRIFKKHNPEYVFHFAALPRVSFSVENPADTTEVNILGTVKLLEKSRDFGIKRFIFSSSSSVYGGARKLPTKEKDNLPSPQSPYALQKLNGEQFCQMFSKLYGLDTVCLRYFNVFGPGQYGDSPYSTVISAWLEALYFPKEKSAFLEGDGKQSRDFCYVDNVVNANIKAMLATKRINGEPMNIAGEERTSLLEVKSLIEKYTKKKLALEKRPERLGDVRHTHADTKKAKKYIGYKPEVNFEEGLKRTVKWFTDERKNK